MTTPSNAFPARPRKPPTGRLDHEDETKAAQRATAAPRGPGGQWSTLSALKPARSDAAAAERSATRRCPTEVRSKKHKRLKWSGRGLMPLWMVEEMKGTKLTKDDFLIK